MSESKVKWQARAEAAEVMLQVCRATVELYHGVDKTPPALFRAIVNALHAPENRTKRVIDVVNSVVREFKAREADSYKNDEGARDE